MPLAEDFKSEMMALLGEAEAARLLAALDDEAPVSVRGNALRGYRAEGDPVAWCADGVYLSRRPLFTLDPLLHAGCYYVQEASSMFVVQAFRALPEVPHRVLDLCAAPGGKSTLWRSLLPDGALLVANEPVRQRAMILAENLAKWGQPDVVVTNAYPADFAPLTGLFDVVAADVPCSGEGMFRKAPAAREEWSLQNVAMCAARQYDIIKEVWPALRPGGHLVYSTCTFNRLENEENVERIARELGAEVLRLSVRPEWGIVESPVGSGAGYRFFPHRTRGEGFFLAVLRKDGEAAPARSKQKKRGRKAPKAQPVREAATLSCWLANDGDFRLFAPDAEHVCALRESLFDDALLVSQAVRTLRAGVPLAEQKGRKWVPRHELALSSVRRKEAFPEVALSEAEAVAYLHRESLVLADAPRGYVVATFAGRALGFLNNLGARANNLYPAEWRIRRAQFSEDKSTSNEL